MERENWTSRLGFILAASGSAIGLGNIWRFPFVTGTNGGAIFILIYLAAITLLGYPILVSEMSLGRTTAKNPIGAFKKIAPNTGWPLVGALGVLSGFVILSYYSVVAGWGMSYIFKSLTFTANNNFPQLFEQHIGSLVQPIFWHGVFMLLTVVVIGAGIVNGIQKLVKYLMPILFIIIILLIFRSLTLNGAARGLSFYLKPDFSEITLQTFADAISQAFFTLSLGMGAMITYGSYLNKKESITESAVYVIIFDTLVALLAGFAIFPAVFSFGFDPASGPGLTFITLPAVFTKMPFGNFFSLIFFVLLTIAALTSSISMLEVVVAFLVDEYSWSRKKASYLVGLLIFLVGIPPLLGYSKLATINFLGMNLLDSYDWITNTIFLPAGGILTAIFVGHIWGSKQAAIEANQNSRLKIGLIYEILLKYIVPLAVLAIMLISIWKTLS
ncbi:sodium-dependent transporter [Halanaerobium salsuginis]|jgi:NSS family neurotransmitter:Na+ symporter|uniref:Transporter n=1 Tax=Halanaerobium salsuginis TaxID=29563 RepID=A0A1I4H1Q6_9FIRM|nr:sodium-dependent transporter [Halanaerobium salsuginis]SFL36208.1 neurotransmitter:Na+ symporter, NSS family [Halanaerobium salsuginis]